VESNVLAKVWVYLLLIIVNVIDTVSTQVLKEELEKKNDEQ
jgi:hypothetical protein